MDKYLEVYTLVSCMNESDFSIISRSNIQTNVVVINQCDEDKVEEFYFINKKGNKCKALFVFTKERGLSKSRNMAVRYAGDADICLLCDDDEILVDDYEDIIVGAFSKSKLRVDLASFSFNRLGGRGHLSNHELKMGIKEICKSSSVELAFRRQSIVDARIYFDEKMGSGTGNGGGEDTMFMMDCRRKGLNMRYFPYVIGTLLESKSRWFSGWNKKLLIDTGWTNRREFGFSLGYCHLLFVVFHHYKDYKQFVNPFQAFYYLNKGFFLKR